MYPGKHFWWEGWWMFPTAMPMIMILVALVVVYSLFGRGGCRPPWEDRYPPGREMETALDILKKRYARGEIKKEEFEPMKKDFS